jgi:polyhydroxybutyrate depolymerase
VAFVLEFCDGFHAGQKLFPPKPRNGDVMQRRTTLIPPSLLALIFVLAVPVAAPVDARELGDGTIRERIREKMEQFRSRRQERGAERRNDKSVDAGGAASGSKTITVNGVARSYILHMPEAGAAKSGPLPVVFALHGAKGTASKIQSYLGLDRVADREGLVAVYPQGIDNTWNDGRTDSARASKRTQPGDDVAFLNALVDELVNQGVADSRRIYISGLSNGGFMSLRMACEGGAKFAAYAPVIASTPLGSKDQCSWPKPLAVVMVNGTADPLVRFDGGEGKFGLAGNFAPPALADYFAGVNGCKKKDTAPIADRDTTDNSTVSVTTWGGCVAGGAVSLYTVNGGGHQAPATSGGRDGWLADKFLGPRNHDIDTAEVIWAFFQKFSR